MKNKEKENALIDFKKMIVASWTYAKMNEEEKNRLNAMLASNQVIEILKGDYSTRYNILNGLYYAYLMALDYNWNWRAEDDSK